MGNATGSLIYVLLFFVGAYLVVVLAMEGVKRIKAFAAKRKGRRADKYIPTQGQPENKADLPSDDKGTR